MKTLTQLKEEYHQPLTLTLKRVDKDVTETITLKRTNEFDSEVIECEKGRELIWVHCNVLTKFVHLYEGFNFEIEHITGKRIGFKILKVV